MPLTGDAPGATYYYLPVHCPDCGWDGMVIGIHPRPAFAVRRHYCGFCGKHHLVDRDPDPDDEPWYRSAKPAEQLVGLSMKEHSKMRATRVAERVGRGFRFRPGKR